MEGNQLENRSHKRDASVVNRSLVHRILHALYQNGVRECCLCPAGRNSPFVTALESCSGLDVYTWPEERSAAFFALGLSKKSNRPVAIITTSGTAVGELLPAVMEAYYTGIPLILVTADRPRHFRGSGAPQTAEQVGIFSHYTPFQLDLAEDDACDMTVWDLKSPAHLNVCFDEPLVSPNHQALLLNGANERSAKTHNYSHERDALDHFLEQAKFPIIMVSTLDQRDRESVVLFLKKLNAPLYLEAISGIREDPRLQHLRIFRSSIWQHTAEQGYPIDSVLRIGGVPTLRMWRDLEKMNIKIHSLSSVPFSGLSHTGVSCVSLEEFFKEYTTPPQFEVPLWLKGEQFYRKSIEQLMLEEPHSEPSLLFQLSRMIPEQSLVYLGNSLPIREWDLAADSKSFQVFANRGLNGIDGQISTFLGLCQTEGENWGLFGDLTTLYDMAAPWIIPQLESHNLNICVINNGGGKIFKRMFSERVFQNPHHLCFESLAKFWSLQYQRWSLIPTNCRLTGPHLIEIIPDNKATERFWSKIPR